MPGLIDTHHHQHETVLRSILADGLWGFQNDMLPKNSYVSVISDTFFPKYLPEDGYIAQLVASLNQINAGVITTVDTSQIHLTPAHTDACIAGLKESGRRAVLSYRAEVPSDQVAARTQAEMARLQKQYFSSKDQLLTLASNASISVEEFQLARSMGLPTVSHAPNESINDGLAAVAKAGLLGPDHEYIHCTRLKEPGWKMIADSGGKLSIATVIEMQMKHGTPPIQAALDHGIRPSLSVDVECNMTADLLTVMRATFLLQRSLVGQRSIDGERNVPAMVTCRDVIEFATLQGARTAHLDSKIGTLTPGKEADIIMLATDRINVFPLNNVPGTVVTLMDTSNVENVFIAGKIMKWQGKLVGVDLNKLRREIEKSRDGLLARTNFPRELFGTCCPGPWTKGGV